MSGAGIFSRAGTAIYFLITLNGYKYSKYVGYNTAITWYGGLFIEAQSTFNFIRLQHKAYFSLHGRLCASQLGSKLGDASSLLTEIVKLRLQDNLFCHKQ